MSVYIVLPKYEHKMTDKQHFCCSGQKMAKKTSIVNLRFKFFFENPALAWAIYCWLFPPGSLVMILLKLATGKRFLSNCFPGV